MKRNAFEPYRKGKDSHLNVLSFVQNIQLPSDINTIQYVHVGWERRNKSAYINSILTTLNPADSRTSSEVAFSGR